MAAGRSLFTFVVVGLLFLESFSNLMAQGTSLPDTIMERELSRAEAYLTSFKNDSAIAITSNLLKALKARGQLNAPFGIRAQLAEALAFEQDQRSNAAIKKLLQVAQLSQKEAQWDVYVKACLSMALLHEKIGQKENSRQQLERVRVAIERYNLDSLYPYFAIRMASWERLYGDKKAALFFAREALRTAPKYQLILEEAISHMLLNMLLPASSLSERMQHCLKAVRLYQQLGDYTGRGSMFNAISRIYYQRKNFRQALLYNDSTLMMANRAIAEGHEQHASIGYYYRFRGTIYKQMELLDSAFINMQKGYVLELALKEKDASDKVIEIDARYQNKYKQKQIEEQQLSLRLKNNQLRLSAIIVFLILLSAIGLFISYRKQRQAKRKLIQQNSLIQNQATQLESLNAARSRFFANISHELRTPLSLIVGPVSTLLKEPHQTKKQTTLLKTVSRSVRQLELMVNDILDLRKLEVGKMTLNTEPTELRSFFQLHLNQFESLASYKRIHYEYELLIVPALLVELDREKCRQILYNLLSNAFKFTPANRTVKVTVWVQADQLFVDVADTGPGIHPDDLPNVFDRFFQTSQTGQYSAGGTGIGLSICHDYTHLMNGEIGVDSKPGEGSTFHVSWPVPPPEKVSTPVAPLHVRDIDALYEAAMPLEESPSAHSADTSRPTILVVEDNPGLRAYIGLILAEQYRVVMAENGAVALQKLTSASTSVDLILSDLMMPVMDGYALLEKLKSDNATRHLPVIMLTARAEPADRLHALRIGVDDYLTKPFDEEELLVRIANLLKNQSVRRQEAFAENKAEDAHPTSEQVWLKTFETYIQENLASDILSIPALSEIFAMSESTLLRHLKRLTGLTPVQYLQEVRLNKARLLLENDPHIPVSIVASEVGYKDARSFSRGFKTRFGKLPSAVLEA